MEKVGRVEKAEKVGEVVGKSRRNFENVLGKGMTKYEQVGTNMETNRRR